MQKLRQITAYLALNLRIKLAGKAVKISKATLLFAVVFVFSLVIYTYTRAVHAPEVYAATSSNLNFQGRILNSAGGVVPDGTYNLEFKLYDGGTSGGPAGTGQLNAGSLLWTEDYINSARVRVVNGYFNVNLGSQTSFPGTINWDQELWLTMNVGGSGGSPSWDGEMLGPSSARTKLTGVPYAFKAGSAKQLLDTQGSFKGILSFLSLTADRTINLPDNNGTLLLDSTGFANGGNTFGSSAVLGTNDLNDLILKTNNSEGLRLDQAGNVSIGTGADGLEKLDVNGGIRISNSTGSNAGTIRWTGTDFEGYDGSGWKSLTAGPTTYINGASASFVSGLANVGANVTGTPVETLVFTTATAVSNTAGVTGFTAPSNGSFSTCLIKNNAAITAGTLNLRWRVNGVSVGSGACTMNSTDSRQKSSALAPGTVKFNAGDTIGIAFDTVGLTPAGTDDFTVYWSVTYDVGISSAGVSFAQGGNSFGGTAILGTNDNNSLNIITNGTTAISVATDQKVTLSNTLTVNSGGLKVTSGGIDNTAGGITNAGALSGVTTINATGAISGATTTDTINGLVINSGSLSSITGYSQASGNFAINSPAGSFSIDSSAFDVSNTGALSGITTINASGAISGAIATDTINGLVINSGALSSITGYSQTSGNLAYNNSSGSFSIDSSAFDVSNTGAVSGVTSLNASGSITASTSGTINGLSISSGSLSSIAGFSQNSGNFSYNNASGSFSIDSSALDVSASGDLTGVNSLTGSGALTLASGGSSALTLNSASNTLLIDATDTGIQRNASGTYNLDLNSSSGSTFAINNSGTGIAGLSVEGGGNFGGNTSITGTLTGLTGLTVNSGGISISGGINNNSGGLSNVGSLAGVSTINASGLITGTAGLNVSGADTFINDGSNFNTNINTGLSNGTVSIGGGNAVFQLNSTAFDVSNTGALSGITTINASGAITGATATNTINGLVINSGSLSSITGYTQSSGNFAQSGSGSFATGSGAVNLNGATAVSTSTNSAVALSVTGTTGTAATAVNIAQNGNASNLALTNTAITAGTLMSLTQSTSAFTGTGLLLNFASGSGSFASGNFADFQVNGTSKFKVDNTGALRITTNSTSGLNVSSTGGLSMLNVDSSGSLVTIGSSTADTNGILLVLDGKTGSDPTGVNGGEYYNATNNKFRCYENGSWKNCLGYTAVRSFVDSTADAVVDANTTNYWDTAAENNNSTPNFILSQASGRSIMGMVTMEVTSTGNNDLEVTGRVERGIGAPPTCGSGTVVGASPGVFSSNNGGAKASTVTFIDNPNTTSTVYYVLCSDSATVGTTGNVTRIRITLQEVENSN